MNGKTSSRPFEQEGRKLRLARVRSGFRLSEFAKRIGKTRQTLGAWENGRGQVDPLLRAGIARLLGIEAADIWQDGREQLVPRGTSQPADRPFAEHVLVTAGRIIELAEGMARDAAKQIAVAESLARRSEEEFQRVPQTPVTRVSGLAAPKRKKHG